MQSLEVEDISGQVSQGQGNCFRFQLQRESEAPPNLTLFQANLSRQPRAKQVLDFLDTADYKR